jgi:hypothetical protein
MAVIGSWKTIEIWLPRISRIFARWGLAWHIDHFGVGELLLAL